MIECSLVYLQELAKNDACRQPAWWNSPWAQAVLSLPKCSADSQAFQKLVEQGAPTAVLLAVWHSCLRHLISHAGSDTSGFTLATKELVDGYPFASVDMIP